MKSTIIALFALMPFFGIAQTLEFTSIETCQTYRGGAFCDTVAVNGSIELIDEFTVLITGEVEEFKPITPKTLVIVEPNKIRFKTGNLSVIYKQD